VQAFEGPGPSASAAHAEVELWPELPLLGMGALETRSEPRIVSGGAGPPLDAARSFEPGHGRHELRTGEPERRRERLAVVVERALLRDRGMAEGAPDNDSAKGAWRSA
jgi:hypothetical protein